MPINKILKENRRPLTALVHHTIQVVGGAEEILSFVRNKLVWVHYNENISTYNTFAAKSL
jgi:hypothetical protein